MHVPEAGGGGGGCAWGVGVTTSSSSSFTHSDSTAVDSVGEVWWKGVVCVLVDV